MTRFEIVRKAILADAGLPGRFVMSLGFLALATLLGVAANSFSAPVIFVPFAPYYPAVLLTALFVDWRWAVGAMAGSMVITGKLFIAPVAEAGLVSGIWERFVLYAFACLVLIWVGDTLRRTVRQMERLAHERDLLSREMLHRVGNTLTVVDALIRLANKQVDAEQFSRDLSGRIRALSAAIRQVLKSSGGTAEVAKLIADATRPFAHGGAISLVGAETWLAESAAHYLMLIVHELSTNALKYGALSTPAGTVAVTWTDTDDGLVLEWREQGGPPVHEPERRGLGMRLLKAQSIFDATVHFRLDGLVCNLRLHRQFSIPEASKVLRHDNPASKVQAAALPAQPVSGA